MKAIVCKSFGPVESLSLETIDNPLTTADSVEIDVIAAGVNFPDGLSGKTRATFYTRHGNMW